MITQDLVIGLSAAKLNQAIAQVHGNRHVHDTVFSNSKAFAYGKDTATVHWDVTAPPEVVLRPPTAAEWQAAVKANGQPVAPLEGAFLVKLPKLALRCESATGAAAAADPLDTTVAVSLIAAAEVTGATISLRALGVLVALDATSALDHYLITVVLVPALLDAVTRALQGLRVVPPAVAGVQLTPGVVAIVADHLVLMFNLAARGAPSASLADVPGDPFFVLISSALLQAAMDHTVQTSLVGQRFDKSGSVGAGGFSAGYEAVGRIDRMAFAPVGPPASFRLLTSVELSASASVGLSLPWLGPVGDAIVHAGEAAGDTIVDLGKKLGDPDTWNPTHWI